MVTGISMNLKDILVIWLMIAATEARFEDFVVKDRNDLTRLGYDDDIADEDYALDEASFSNIEFLQQLSEIEPNIMDFLNGVSLEDMPPGLLRKLQQYYTMMDSATCMDDDDMWQTGEFWNSYDINRFDDTLQLE
ncbi:uncharacterized protein LOC115066472 [Bactrocera dorsalis]|uniref:Uncharacterized protein LOC115066472 n=1 Tax=Bactrocera dorsalis TaxID=27457 RepID=A0A8N4L3T6_BACDO|nr:uncharacterized protein LOC115066472 [Bactrocera dorsalis]